MNADEIRRRSTMPTNRRGATVGKDSDVSTAAWPVTTLSSYQMVLKEVAGTPEEQLNLKMTRLCETRAKLGHLILAFKNCRALWKDKDQVVLRLGEIERYLETAMKDFPLEIRNR